MHFSFLSFLFGNLGNGIFHCVQQFFRFRHTDFALPRRDVVFRICLPQMLPPVLSQTGPDLSLALKVTVSAEVLASAFPAIGRLINDAQLYNNTAQVFALTVSMLAVGGLVEFLCSRLTLITARWTGREGGHAH